MFLKRLYNTYNACLLVSSFFFFNDTATTEIYTLSLHDALPICPDGSAAKLHPDKRGNAEQQKDEKKNQKNRVDRSEEHTSELQSHSDLVCRLLLEKKKKNEILTNAMI